MKKTILTLTIALASMTFCNAQKIEMEKVFGGYKFTQYGKKMTMSDLARTMESNQQAYAFIKKAQTNNTFATIFGFAGGGLVGYQIGTALGGGEPNWAIAGVGAGLIVAGIPFTSGANKNARKALETYNEGLVNRDGTTFIHSVNFAFTGNGFSLALQF